MPGKLTFSGKNDGGTTSAGGQASRRLHFDRTEKEVSCGSEAKRVHPPALNGSDPHPLKLIASSTPAIATSPSSPVPQNIREGGTKDFGEGSFAFMVEGDGGQITINGKEKGRHSEDPVNHSDKREEGNFMQLANKPPGGVQLALTNIDSNNAADKVKPNKTKAIGLKIIANKRVGSLGIGPEDFEPQNSANNRANTTIMDNGLGDLSKSNLAELVAQGIASMLSPDMIKEALSKAVQHTVQGEIDAIIGGGVRRNRGRRGGQVARPRRRIGAAQTPEGGPAATSEREDDEIGGGASGRQKRAVEGAANTTVVGARENRREEVEGRPVNTDPVLEEGEYVGVGSVPLATILGSEEEEGGIEAIHLEVDRRAEKGKGPAESGPARMCTRSTKRGGQSYRAGQIMDRAKKRKEILLDTGMIFPPFCIFNLLPDSTLLFLANSIGMNTIGHDKLTEVRELEALRARRDAGGVANLTVV